MFPHGLLIANKRGMDCLVAVQTLMYVRITWNLSRYESVFNDSAVGPETMGFIL